jgi:hypothetical protein
MQQSFQDAHIHTHKISDFSLALKVSLPNRIRVKECVGEGE